jgi:hypothetical protein
MVLLGGGGRREDTVLLKGDGEEERGVEERGRGKLDILPPFSLLDSQKLIFY